MNTETQIAVFGGGCFWCTEAVFDELRGVISVTPGYAGGHIENPTYENVCSGKTGYAEVVRIEYDPDKISFKDLLTVFFATHDPTTLNRQGSDTGTQYRSAIFYTGGEQERETKEFIKELDENSPEESIVTELRPLEKFFPAEEYHRNYYFRNKQQPYCQLIISPKLEKLENQFQALLKQKPDDNLS